MKVTTTSLQLSKRDFPFLGQKAHTMGLSQPGTCLLSQSLAPLKLLSAALSCVVHGPRLGHPQPLHPEAGLGLPPRAHSRAGTLQLKPGGSTDLETPPYFMGSPPRF